MEQNKKLARAGYIAFFLSGICAISSGVIVSILQEKYQLSFGITGTMISVMSIGNMAASFASGILPTKIGTRMTAAILCLGYFVGYLLMSVCGIVGVLLASFLIVGFAKGCTINNCTVLVGNNSPDRTKGLSLMHACYACGAMLCPFLIGALVSYNSSLPMIGIAVMGFLLWLTFMTAGLPGKSDGNAAAARTDFSFMKTGIFWLVTALIFCQNAAETAVTGWMVTYYKTTGILSGSLSTYTVTIMWGATLIGRLLLAFVIQIKDKFKALAFMGIACTLTYSCLVLARQPLMAVGILFLFAFSMAGVNPMGTAGIGQMMSSASVGVLLPLAGMGQIIMPWVIGIAADHIGLQVAMALNLVPCIGIFILSTVLSGISDKKKN